jgi:hypothetical protein
MIAAAGTDELKQVVAAALDTAVNDVGRLIPQESRAAVAGLTGGRARVGDVGPGTRPQVAEIMGIRCGDGNRMGIQCGTDHGVRAAHSTHRQALVPAAAMVCSSDVAYHLTLTCGSGAGYIRPSRMMPDHPLLRFCFLTV